MAPVPKKPARRARAKRTLVVTNVLDWPTDLQALLAEARQRGEVDSEQVYSTLEAAVEDDEHHEERVQELAEQFTAELARQSIDLVGDDDEVAAVDVEVLQKQVLGKTAKIEAEVTDTVDSTRLYLNQICRNPLLTAREEKALAAQKDWLFDPDATAHQKELGRRAKERMVEGNLRLVVSIAKNFSNNGMDMLDLVQHGNIGLMRAIDKYDHTKGFKLSTYATWWIRQSISRALADEGRTIRIPVHKMEVLNRYKKALRELTAQLGHEPTDAQVADALRLTVGDVEEIKRINQETVSLDQRVGDGDTEMGDLIPDDHATRPEFVAMEGTLEHELNELLGSLPLRERQVLTIRYGLGGEPDRTLEETGDKIGITRERVRQIEQKAKERIRASPKAALLRELRDQADHEGD